MIALILRRLLQSVGVMLAVVFIAFILSDDVGDPVMNIGGRDASSEQREVLREQLGLNDPAPIRFVRYIGNVMRGEYGISYRTSEPVAGLIWSRLPATLELAVVAALMALVLGIAMGVYCAIRPDGVGAKILMTVSLVGVSIPTFLIGILLIMIFAVWLGVLPSSGRGDVVDLVGWSTGFFTLSGLRALILPSVTLAVFQLTLIMRLVRAEMLEVLRSDFIKFARARGLPERLIHLGYALRNTLVPVITVMGMQLGNIIAFSVVTETVFNWPGIGLLFLQSVQFADIPVIAAYLMLVALMFVIINLAVDLGYYAIDPRIRGDLRAGSGR